MKKTFKVIFSVLACMLLVFTLASCSAEKKFEKYEEKINVAAAKEDYISYDEVVKKLGDPTQNATVSLGNTKETGFCIWYAGCEDMDELKEKLEEGKEVPYIYVTFNDGDAIEAEFGIKEK